MFDSVLKLRCSTIVAQLYTQPRGLLGQPGSMGCIPKCCEIATVFHICVKSECWMLTLRLFDGVIPKFSGQTSDFLDKSIFSRTHPPNFLGQLQDCKRPLGERHDWPGADCGDRPREGVRRDPLHDLVQRNRAPNRVTVVMNGGSVVEIDLGGAFMEDSFGDPFFWNNNTLWGGSLLLLPQRQLLQRDQHPGLLAQLHRHRQQLFGRDLHTGLLFEPQATWDACGRAPCPWSVSSWWWGHTGHTREKIPFTFTSQELWLRALVLQPIHFEARG